jgi:hypothetical protein
METNYLEKALEVANLIQDEKERSETLCAIAIHLASRTRNCEKVLEICRKISDPKKRSTVYIWIGLILVSEGLAREGIETILLSECLNSQVYALLDLYDMIGNEKERVCWLHRVKNYLFVELKKDPPQKCDGPFKELHTLFLHEELYEEALALGDYFENPKEKLFCFYDVAEAYVHEGNIDKALEVAWKVQNKQDQATIYDMIAKLWILRIETDVPRESGKYIMKSLSGLRTGTLYLEDVEASLVAQTQNR